MILAWEEENKIVYPTKEGQPINSCLVLMISNGGGVELICFFPPLFLSLLGVHESRLIFNVALGK
jgi:hypothetical protein